MWKREIGPDGSEKQRTHTRPDGDPAVDIKKRHLIRANWSSESGNVLPARILPQRKSHSKSFPWPTLVC